MVSLPDICPTWPDYILAQPSVMTVSQQSDEFWSGAGGFLLRVNRSSSAAASERITVLSTDA